MVAAPGGMGTHPARVSIVVPVYRGERTLPELLREITPLTFEHCTPAGNRAMVCEVLLVHDCGPDRSDLAIKALATQYGFVRPVWLSRNFGQHAATLAGMATAVGDWVATVDEDLQHDPRDIDAMLDNALAQGLQVVYAQPANSAPHGVWRNAASRVTKRLARAMIGDGLSGGFSSFRLVEGEMARSLAAYCSSGVYLDVALRWIVGRVGYCSVHLRCEGDRPTGYSIDRLLSHFSRLVRTAGARPLRVIAFAGLGSIGVSAGISAYAAYAKLTGRVPVEGWASLVIALSFFSGCILTALGVIAEYLAQTMSISMGKPPYVVSSKPSGSRERA
jgi:undecaprenyl-phosphate 4-deoxy-4-formamido-L-arabinose transferase